MAQAKVGSTPTTYSSICLLVGVTGGVMECITARMTGYVVQQCGDEVAHFDY